MKKTKTIQLNADSIGDFINYLKDKKKWLEKKRDEICEKLANIGLEKARVKFSQAKYDGINDTVVQLKKIKNGYVVRAKGENVLFIEFGAGITYGYGHPDVQKYGPGTYPNGKGHWNDPKGWYVPKSKGGYHTFGNPPNAPMYNTMKELEEDVLKIVKEVLGND